MEREREEREGEPGREIKRKREITNQETRDARVREAERERVWEIG